MKLIVLFISFFCLSTLAQNKEYSIVVKDIETQLPIENATVVILKTKHILLSNAEGKVSFLLSGASNVQVSGVNFNNISLRWSVIVENNFIIYLENKNIKVDEVVITKESPEKILQKIVSNSLKRISSSYRLKVYVKEFFLLNGKHSFYNDGLVNFQFSLRQKKMETTLLVEQNRSYGLLDNDVSADLKGYNLNDIMENYCSFKYFEPILNAKTQKDYEFSIKKFNGNNEYYMMYIVPLANTKKVLDDFQILYDWENKIILGYTINITPENLANIVDNVNVGAKNITKSYVNVNFRLDNLNYYLLNSKEEIAYNLILKNEIKNIHVSNSFVTTNFNKQNFTYNQRDVLKDKSLFNKRNTILTNYWDVSGLTATEQERTIINSLNFKE